MCIFLMKQYLSPQQKYRCCARFSFYAMSLIKIYIKEVFLGLFDSPCFQFLMLSWKRRGGIMESFLLGFPFLQLQLRSFLLYVFTKLWKSKKHEILDRDKVLEFFRNLVERIKNSIEFHIRSKIDEFTGIRKY